MASSGSLTIGQRFSESIIASLNKIIDQEQTNREAVPTIEKSSNREELLATGIWDPITYSRALKKCGKEKRFKWMVDSRASVFGRLPFDCFSWTKTNPFNHELKPNVPPSEALSKIFNSLSLLGCDEARQIATYTALLEVLGKDKFDYLFASDSPTPMSIGKQDPCKRLFKVIEPTDIRKGDFLYIPNIEEYVSKHPFGSSRGYNAIYSGDKRVVSLGFPKGGLPLDTDQMDTFLSNQCNEPPTPDNFFNPDFIKEEYTRCFGSFAEGKQFVHSSRELRCRPEEIRELKKNYGTTVQIWETEILIDRCVRISERSITDLAQAPLSEVRQLFQSMKVILPLENPAEAKK